MTPSALALSLFLALLTTACASAPPEPTATARAGLPVYDGMVGVDPATGKLSGDWTISFVADSARADSLRLYLNRGLTVSRLSGGSIAGFSQIDTSGTNVITVRFTPNVVSGSVVQFQVVYTGTPVFGSDSINSIRADWVELGLDSDWHPVFAGYDQQITGRVLLGLPAGWQAVASGSTVRSDGSILLTNMLPLIDIAFAAAPQIHSVLLGYTTVYHTRADSATVERVLQTTAGCVGYLNERYAAREALPNAKIVIAPRNGPGYARKNYIVITDVRELNDAALSRFLCHELAHFWSSNAISTGPENWLNEGLAEFVAARAVRSIHGDVAYAEILKQFEEQSAGQPPVWTPTATRRPTARTAYRKAPFIMHQLEQRIGVATMDRILARYMTERISNTPALLRMISEVAGADHAAWLEGELGK